MKYKRASSQAYQRLSSVWPEVFLGIIGVTMYGVSGGIVGVLLGWCVAAVMQILDNNRASELEWGDVEMACYNYARFYRPGVGKLVFEVTKKQINLNKQAVLRVTEGERFVVWYKTDQWNDILDETDKGFFSDLCQKRPVEDPKWDRGKTFLIPQQEDTEQVMEVCLALVKHFITKSGSVISDVTARDRFAHSSVWVDSRFQEVSPVPIGCFNFKGKINGRPVIYVTDRKGYWILQEDGKLEPFADFDAWYNTPSKKQPDEIGREHSC